MGLDDLPLSSFQGIILVDYRLLRKFRPGNNTQNNQDSDPATGIKISQFIMEITGADGILHKLIIGYRFHKNRYYVSECYSESTEY